MPVREPKQLCRTLTPSCAATMHFTIVLEPCRAVLTLLHTVDRSLQIKHTPFNSVRNNSHITLPPSRGTTSITCSGEYQNVVSIPSKPTQKRLVVWTLHRTAYLWRPFQPTLSLIALHPHDFLGNIGKKEGIIWPLFKYIGMHPLLTVFMKKMFAVVNVVQWNVNW